jgi:hypothetical protein
MGCDVTINAILGLPFIQQTKMVIDTADQVAELCALNKPLSHWFPPRDVCGASCQ